MKKYLILLILTILNLSIIQNLNAQSCNANFTYSVNTDYGLQLKIEPNDLLSILSTEWYLDGVLLSYSPEVIHTFPSSGSHIVCLKVVDTAGDTCIRCINICVNMAFDGDTVSTSISTPNINKSVFEIYPNPTFNKVSIQFNTNDIKINTEYSVKIIDVAGQVQKSIVYRTKIGENEISLYVADLPIGIYLINISSDEISESHKFVKQ